MGVHHPAPPPRQEGPHLRVTLALIGAAVAFVAQIAAGAWIAGRMAATWDASARQVTERMAGMEHTLRDVAEDLNAITADLRQRVARLEALHEGR